ncbi:MAG: hypothetical protein ACFNOM_04430, partial [Parascardovia denticolens]
ENKFLDNANDLSVSGYHEDVPSSENQEFQASKDGKRPDESGRSDRQDRQGNSGKPGRRKSR